MRLRISKRIGHFKISLMAGMVTDIIGVNSTLKDGNHIVMWEFDNCTHDEVHSWLFRVQGRYNLPNIYISESSRGGGYHAYCLHRTSWRRSLHIVSGTKGVDEGYISMCAMRKHWTLRLTDKGQGCPVWIETLPSHYLETATLAEVRQADGYQVWMNKEMHQDAAQPQG